MNFSFKIAVTSSNLSAWEQLGNRIYFSLGGISGSQTEQTFGHGSPQNPRQACPQSVILKKGQHISVYFSLVFFTLGTILIFKKIHT